VYVFGQIIDKENEECITSQQLKDLCEEKKMTILTKKVLVIINNLLAGVYEQNHCLLS